jgi:TM2 domain-containing membrane protein YozV
MSDQVSDKSMVPAALLCFFLGVLGIHRFYIGRQGTAILMILTLVGLGIWQIIDLVRIITGGLTDGQGRVLQR